MGFEKEALYLFSEFHRSGLRPDDASVRCVLSVVSEIGYNTGTRSMEQIQANLPTCGFVH